MFDSVHREVLRRLAPATATCTRRRNVMLTATHTHARAGRVLGTPALQPDHHGFHRSTFEAIVDGIVSRRRGRP